jgi:Transposase DDE domain
MTTVPELAHTLQPLLTTTANALARRTGFVQRQSKMSGALFAQALVFGWLATPHASLENLAQAAAAVGVAISPQGLDQRCTEAAAVFLAALLGAAVQAVVTADPVALPLLQRFSAVMLLDCSTIVLPDALGLWWPGCGGRTPAPTGAALKIGVRYDRSQGQVVGPLLFDGRTHQSTPPIQHAPLPPGALRRADLGVVALAVLAALSAQDGYWLGRLPRTTAIYDAAGQRWAGLALLAAQGTPQVDLMITLGVQQHLSARLLAVRVPQEVAAQRRRRLRTQARDHGRSPSATRLAGCDWTLFVTNVPPDLLSLREALVLARARWQIELLFKLWKSHGQIDVSRSHKPWRVRTEVCAKLLALVVQHWLLLTGCWAYPDRSLVKAAQTVRQHALHLASALACPALLCRVIGVIQRCLAAGCRLNRRKTKPNTYQLLLDPSLAELG